MIQPNLQNRLTLDFAQGGFLDIAVDLFLTDRRASGLAVKTLEFYRFNLGGFIRHCSAQAVKTVQEITPDFLRRYLLLMGENHTPGGVHGAFRTLRVFLRWVEFEEVMPPEWKNPIHKVRPPKVSQEPLDPVSLDAVRLLISSCKGGDNAVRDKAIFLTLLDTGLRAQELCGTNRDDFDMGVSSINIRKGKGNKSRLVFIGRTTRRALRAYLRTRADNSPALFATEYGDRLTYSGLREILRRRAKDAGMEHGPTLHSFRRAFALNFLRNGGDIFSLQRLMGHADLSVLRRYLAQTEQDMQAAHLRASPVDNGL